MGYLGFPLDKQLLRFENLTALLTRETGSHNLLACIIFFLIIVFILQDTYFLPRGGDKKNPGGIIANKVNTLRSQARKRKRQDEEHELHLNAMNDSELNEDPNSSGRDAYDWLIDNASPWTTVLDRWKASFSIRSKLLTKPNPVDELVKSKLWNLITSEYGHQLVSQAKQIIQLHFNKYLIIS